MARTSTTTLFRVALADTTSIWREIEITKDGSLYELAEAIVGAFNFDFDHAFGFYTGLTHQTMMRKQPKYELFADMDDADTDAKSVHRTAIGDAFRKVGDKMLFLFDYGDSWLFRVELIGEGQKIARRRYPRVTAKEGSPPVQYPSEEDEE